MKVQEVIFFLFFACVCVVDKGVIQKSGKEGTCEDKTPGTPGNTARHRGKRFTPPGDSKTVSAEQDPGKKCRKSDQEGAAVSTEVIKTAVYLLCLVFETGITAPSALWRRSSDRHGSCAGFIKNPSCLLFCVYVDKN